MGFICETHFTTVVITDKILLCKVGNNGSVALFDYTLVLVSAEGNVLAKPIKITLDVENSNRCAVTGAMVGDEVLAGNVLSVKAGDVAKLVD